MDGASFRRTICELISQVPRGMVTTYGDLAAMSGYAYAARQVGYIAHSGPSWLPWHRLVNRFGGMASGFPGGQTEQMRLLSHEGVRVSGGVVKNFAEHRWRPDPDSNVNPLTRPILALVGPTASGKTDLAVRLALKYNGEIICADSRTIYQFADIATAKPSPAQQLQVRHYGLDLIPPGEKFSAVDFKLYAIGKIADIQARGRLPILVGGSGLYIDGVLLNYSFAPAPLPRFRKELELMSVQELTEYSTKHNINLDGDLRNKRRMIRQIERSNATISSRSKPYANTIVVGISTSIDELKNRIRLRARAMLDFGVVDEAIRLADTFGWDELSSITRNYSFIKSYLEHEYSEDVLVDKITTNDWHLARRQMTWWRRNKFIHWANSNEINAIVDAEIENLSKTC